MTFLDFFQLLPLPADAMHGHYNLYLVTLSYIVATLTSYVALEIASYLRKGISKTIFWPIFGGAFAMGAGIFSMHFIGMLAFIMPMHMGYKIYLTLLSLAVAITASALALFIVRKPKLSTARLLYGGFIIGIAIAGMHYIGMSAMNGVTITYLPTYFFLSILIAVSAASVALWMMLQCEREFLRHQKSFKAISSLIMGAAICGMHYTGMAAAVFVPSETAMMVQSLSAISPENLSFLIACLTALILSIGLYVIDKQLSILLKLLFGYFIVLLLVVPIAYTSLENIKTSTQAFNIVTKVTFPKIEALIEMKASAARITQIVESIEDHDTAEAWNRKKKELLRELQHLKNYEQTYLEKGSQSLSSHASQLQELNNSIHVQAQHLITSKEKNLSLQEIAKLKDEMNDADHTLSQFIERQLTIENQAQEHLQERDRLLKHQSYYLTIAVAFVTFILALFLSIFISVRISRSIIQLKRASHEIANGELHKRVDIQSDDEIGQLGKSFNMMASALEDSNRKRDEFLGMAAHDLRIPASVITEASSLLSKEASGGLQPKQLRLTQMIQQASSSMISLLDELLSVNAVNAKSIQINPTYFDLYKLMLEIDDLYQLVAEKKQITLKFDYLSEEKMVFLDRNKISQVINNFLSNALKFSPSDSAVNIVIKKIGNHLRFEVHDQAGGIPEKEHKLVFTWFAKISVKPTGGEASHGLGLAICRDIILAHEGEIGFESEFGQGSVFYFEVEAFQEP